MRKKEFAFEAGDLLDALDEAIAFAKGKATLRTTELPRPPKAAVSKPSRIIRIRQRLNVSQSVFARLLNVSPVTAKSWESGRRQPSGPACRLLEIAESHPGLFAIERQHAADGVRPRIMQNAKPGVAFA